MRLYVAGAYSSNFQRGSPLYNRLTENEKYQRDCVSHLLESYHYVHRQTFVDRLRANGERIFLDSGAFSAFTKGVTIDLKGYCDYIKRNADIIETQDGTVLASVLDGIGDPLKTYQNQLLMEQHGVRPLPCFHYGEDPRYLDWYVANYDYITIGGMVHVSTQQLQIWLDRIWERNLTDGSGRPKLKVHGFGMTTPDLMRRYPWYSVDSSRWVQVAQFGQMFMLPGGEVITVSEKSPTIKNEGQHIENLSPPIRKALEDKLISCGVDLERVRTNYASRWSYNIWAFEQLGKLLTKEDPRFIPDQAELF